MIPARMIDYRWMNGSHDKEMALARVEVARKKDVRRKRLASLRAAATKIRMRKAKGK